MTKEKVESNLEGKKFITFKLPYYAISEGDYWVLKNGKHSLVRIKRIQKKSKEDFTTLTGFKFETSGSGSFEIKGDRFGLTDYSEITIFHDFKEIESIKQFALELHNRIVRIYRCVSRKYWIQLVPRRDIYSITSGIVKNGKFQLGRSGLFTEKGPQEKFVYYEGEEIDKNIKKILLTEEEPPLYVELLLNAREFAAKEDFRLAIVEGCIALESFLYTFLEQKLKKKRFTKEAIKQLLGGKKVSYLLKKTFKLAFSKTFDQIDQRLWLKWADSRNGVMKLRNDVVHRGKRDISESEGLNALETIEKIITTCENLQVMKK